MRVTLTVGIVVSPESDHHQAFLFREDGLVHMPGCLQVRDDDRTHYDGWFSLDRLEYAEWEKEKWEGSLSISPPRSKLLHHVTTLAILNGDDNVV